MAVAGATDWRTEFGVHEREPPNFFARKSEITSAAPQAYLLRKAFDLLDLDGVLCTESAPLVYFKQVSRINVSDVFDIHRQFWNHGGAPILVLISNDEVQIYSGMSRPVPPKKTDEALGSLVKTIDRATESLREFLTSVESGEFFRQFSSSFNPDHRIDRDLLRNLKSTREVLDEITNRDISPQVLDALLCRLVFTCYLFDRKVIGQNYLEELNLSQASHLREVLRLSPTRDAKAALYTLFKQLGQDFNGDLFSDDLDAESRQITLKHVEALRDFFEGTDVRSGQRSFWPYDFGTIPIETISAIYEHFLKADDHQAGAFYTPRFLAEVVLDTALEGVASLQGKTFLDPACGSGIFLVALFNRLAEEWKLANPTARNDRRARELMQLLQKSLFGVDISPTACRITAFSLYLAYLDQLAPRDIQELQAKGRALPNLIAPTSDEAGKLQVPAGNIWCADFFSDRVGVPQAVDVVIGNPPWGSIADSASLASRWCKRNKKPLPDKQIATAFVWKSADHIADNGLACLILPHGVLFNHSSTAVEFQKTWVNTHTLSKVLNLADYRWFLFEKAVHPAIVVTYSKRTPNIEQNTIQYWAPKADWAATQAEVIAVSPIDRSEIRLKELATELQSLDAPQTWKQHLWATPRDIRFLDRLSLYPRLRDLVRAPKGRDDKPWTMAEGFQPLGDNDDPERAHSIKLPSRLFIEAKSPGIDLFLLNSDCDRLPSAAVTVRNKSNKNIEIFRAPHVLITKGFNRIAFSDFDVSFRHAVRGIHGPAEHRDYLIFLAAYLRTPLARYFMFHTSSSWGMYRPEGHVSEVLRLPFFFPDSVARKKIIRDVAKIVDRHTINAEKNFIARTQYTETATELIEPLINEYFELQPVEKILVDDATRIIIPSVQPRRTQMPVPTIEPSSDAQRASYASQLTESLNRWSTGISSVKTNTVVSSSSGIGLVVLEKINNSKLSDGEPVDQENLIRSIERLRKLIFSQGTRINLLRGLKIFENNKLYIVKPLGQRYWTRSAAINDADEIAGTILMHSYKDRS